MVARAIGCLIVVLSLGGAAEAQAADGFFDGLMDRAAESAKRKAQDRVNQRMDQSIDKAINKSEEAVKCLATDQECLKRAKEEGKNVVLVESPTGSDAMKCVVTDTSCMKRAKQAGKKVESWRKPNWTSSAVRPPIPIA